MQFNILALTVAAMASVTVATTSTGVAAPSGVAAPTASSGVASAPSGTSSPIGFANGAAGIQASAFGLVVAGAVAIWV